MSRALNHHLKRESDKQVVIARREGRLPVADACEACAADDRRIVMHHHDYSKPLDVIPLCDLCHSSVHAGTILEPRTGRMYPKRRKRASLKAGVTAPASAINKYLVRWRERAKMTQAEAVKKANISRTSLSAWERGHVEPKWSQVLALLDVYGVSAEDRAGMMGGERDPEASRGRQMAALKELLRQLEGGTP